MASGPLMLSVLDSKLRESKTFLDIASFMHKKYTDYLLTCLNGNTQVMDLVDGWCKMGKIYDREIDSLKNDIKSTKMVEILSKNAEMNVEIEGLKKEISIFRARDEARVMEYCKQIGNKNNK